MCFNDFINSVAPVIMGRGKDYYESGYVDEVRRMDDDTWVAEVDGSRVYQVELRTARDSVSYWKCSCPYDGPVCKHVVAVCFAILEGEAIDMRERIAEDNNAIETIVNAMDINELRRVVIDFLSRNPEQKGKFILRNLPKTEIDYSQAVKDISEYPTNAADYYEDCRDLLDSIKHSDAAESPDVLWDLLQNLIVLAIPTLKDLYEVADLEYDSYDYDMDDPYQYYEELCSEVYQSCMALMEDADNTLKRKIFGWALSYIDTGNDEQLDLVMELADAAIMDEQMADEYLACMDRIITNDDEWDDAQVRLAIRSKVLCLKTFGRNQEAIRIIKDNQHDLDMRILLIEELIETGDYATAKKLCNRYLQDAGAYSHHRTRLMQLKLRISDLEGDPESQVESRKQFFLHSRDISHYRDLKSFCPKELWKKCSEEIEAALIEDSMREHILAQVYRENADYGKLLQLLAKKKGLSELHLSFGAEAAKADMDEFLDLYQNAIWDAMSETGRPHYEYVARHLHNLLDISEDYKLVNSLVSELKQVYFNRRAMIEIFDREFARNR